jgi:hypothetical protein
MAFVGQRLGRCSPIGTLGTLFIFIIRESGLEANYIRQVLHFFLKKNHVYFIVTSEKLSWVYSPINTPIVTGQKGCCLWENLGDKFLGCWPREILWLNLTNYNVYSTRHHCPREIRNNIQDLYATAKIKASVVIYNLTIHNYQFTKERIPVV